MSAKVTDLEKFLDEIWLPYWPSHPDCGPRKGNMPESYRDGLKRMGRKRHSLNETFVQLSTHQGSDWERMVIRRIRGVGYWFPDYIDHPLVRYLQQRIVETEEPVKQP